MRLPLIGPADIGCPASGDRYSGEGGNRRVRPGADLTSGPPTDPARRRPPPLHLRCPEPLSLMLGSEHSSTQKPAGCGMADLVLTTFDWVSKAPRGYVRDLRVRWALEEAGLPYRVESVPFRTRTAAHLSHQPFGQAPWLTDGDVSIFESGAILLYLGERSIWASVAES